MTFHSAIQQLEQPNADEIFWIAERLDEFAKNLPSDSRLLSSPILESHLQSLQAAIEVGMEDLSAATEVGGMQIMQNVGRIKTEASGVILELSTCRSQLKTLVGRLHAIGANQLSSLAILSEIDTLKGRLAACRSVLSELHQWDVRARELELLLKTLTADQLTSQPGGVRHATETPISLTGGISGNLGQAVSNLVEMKEAASMLENLMQFEGKLKWLSNYEKRLLDACRDSIYSTVEFNNKSDCIQCAQVSSTNLGGWFLVQLY